MALRKQRLSHVLYDRMMQQVSRSGEQQIWPVIEAAESVVALVAKQRSDCAGCVAVVHVKYRGLVLTAWRSTADSALAVLRGVHSLVIFWGEIELDFQVALASVGLLGGGFVHRFVIPALPLRSLLRQIGGRICGFVFSRGVSLFRGICGVAFAQIGASFLALRSEVIAVVAGSVGRHSNLIFA
jgi:hypothetical protein